MRKSGSLSSLVGKTKPKRKKGLFSLFACCGNSHDTFGLSTPSKKHPKELTKKDI